MRVLGIETSCDDTAVGIITLTRGRLLIEGQITASQALIHRKYGGVIPEVAAREHAITVLPTIAAAMAQAKKSWKDIDLIAVTGGPGLSTALAVGVEAARTLAYALPKPVLRINHIEGHIASTWAAPESTSIRFPAIALVVSGGHTELLMMKKFGQYALLGKTIDDAAGEAFDKTAKVLGLPYPGGPEISKAALAGNSQAYTFPRSLLGRESLDFSYSGLKTAVLYETMRHRRLSARQVRDIAASFQVAAIEPLVEKTSRAIRRTNAKTVLLAGGVAANAMLRERLGQRLKNDHPQTALVRAPISLCADNGVMIAIAGAFHGVQKQRTPWAKLTADPGWELA